LPNSNFENIELHDENKTHNLLETPETALFQEQINPNINFDHIQKVIKRYFEEFLHNTDLTFERKTKHLNQTIERALETPNNGHAREFIVEELKTNLQFLYEQVSFDEKESTNLTYTEINNRYTHVADTFSTTIPELSFFDELIPSEDNLLGEIDNNT
ncbi:hypothetical protein DID76_04385, partial [Candidatus Marinamargulisbacteria bacterium SCGC AG-414-C22]